ncbi:MAG: ABC transporter permease, partial [Alphaproteobacteria bacterium]|nr:ABC transporter permease [Alphaproteobacteria bacterium]
MAVTQDQDVRQAEEKVELSPSQALWLRMKNHRGLVTGFFIIVTLILLAILAPVLAPEDPYLQNLTTRLLPPVWSADGVWAHPLGTDHLGRDYLSRLLYGARISLVIGLGAACIGCFVGSTMGICAGYFGGKVDHVVSYLLTCQLSLPGLLLTMSLVFLIGPSVTVVICVIGFLHWTYFLIVTRAATMQIRQLDYITAARALGTSRRKIIAYDILPNVMNQIIVVFTLEVGVAIIAEASLSFLGVGVPAPSPSWGLMIAEGKASMFFRPWLVVLP